MKGRVIVFGISRIIDGVINICMFPIVKYANRGHQERILDMMCDKLENNNTFFSFRLRPKDSCDIPIINNVCTNRKFAIVLQGPIYKKDDMTVKSIKYYKAVYPDAFVILSTWEDESDVLVEACKSAGAIIVRSKKPTIQGTLNVNYQIINSYAGIKKASELGAEFVAKTRTDQRICKPHVFEAMIDLIKNFPIKKECDIDSRIVMIPTHVGNMFTPYFMSDFFYFGSSKDMLKLFSVEIDSRSMINNEDVVSRRDYSKEEIPPEIYILKKFLKKYTSMCVNDSIKCYWEAIKDYFICMDRSLIDLYIVKYDYSHMDHVSNGTYFKNDDSERNLTNKFGFVEWLNLYYGDAKYEDEYEKKADIALK